MRILCADFCKIILNNLTRATVQSRRAGPVTSVEALNSEILQRQEAEALAQALSEALAVMHLRSSENERRCHILQRLHIAHAKELRHYHAHARRVLACGQSPASLYTRIARHQSAVERRLGMWCHLNEGEG